MLVEVWDLSVKMLGKPHKPIFSAKAKETAGLLLFCVQLLEKYQHKLVAKGGNIEKCCHLLLSSGRAAVRFEELLSTGGEWPDVRAQQSMLDALLRHLSLAWSAGMTLTPKHHLMIHAVQRMATQGSLQLYSTYHDEALNRLVAAIARSAHAWTFSETINFKYACLAELEEASENLGV